MKITNLCIVFIFFLLISNYVYSNEIKIYNCNINLSTNIKNISPLEMSAPTEIKIVYNSKTNNLIDYIWNKKSVVDDFELISNNFNLEFIEIGRKGYKKTLSDEDIRNGLYFKLQLNELRANLKKQFVRPVNYNCR
tara:strand:- start:190 stop:597 length:408 start_codon:yes stop_codon:yes gene_type:complete